MGKYTKDLQRAGFPIVFEDGVQQVKLICSKCPRTEGIKMPKGVPLSTLQARASKMGWVRKGGKWLCLYCAHPTPVMGTSETEAFATAVSASPSADPPKSNPEPTPMDPRMRGRSWDTAGKLLPKLSEDLVRQAAGQIAAGEGADDVAARYGVTRQGLGGAIKRVTGRSVRQIRTESKEGLEQMTKSSPSAGPKSAPIKAVEHVKGSIAQAVSSGSGAGATKVVPIRQLSPKEIKALTLELETVFDEVTGAYARGFSDKAVADKLALPLANVREYREAAYGPLKVNPEIDALLEEAGQLQNNLALFKAEVHRRIGTMEERLQELLEKAAKL